MKHMLSLARNEGKKTIRNSWRPHARPLFSKVLTLHSCNLSTCCPCHLASNIIIIAMLSVIEAEKTQRQNGRVLIEIINNENSISVFPKEFSLFFKIIHCGVWCTCVCGFLDLIEKFLLNSRHHLPKKKRKPTKSKLILTWTLCRYWRTCSSAKRKQTGKRSASKRLQWHKSLQQF